MKKITALLLAASLLFVIACEDKEEEVFSKVSIDIDPIKRPENGGEDHDDGP